jgi:hypothetical protein
LSLALFNRAAKRRLPRMADVSPVGGVDENTPDNFSKGVF